MMLFLLIFVVFVPKFTRILVFLIGVVYGVYDANVEGIGWFVCLLLMFVLYGVGCLYGVAW